MGYRLTIEACIRDSDDPYQHLTVREDFVVQVADFWDAAKVVQLFHDLAEEIQSRA